ncbi:MAG TPA: PilZ domain-containing protein [Candidatus Dormibacteraeota bacterium]|nr:PilZ domain-containing protein [Candidatus Dormibacteraeota bacterium]
MTLSALLVCVDQAAAEVLQRVLQELSIRVESCPDFARASIRAAQERFDVIVVDGESTAAVLSLLQETRMSRLNDSTLAVAVVPSQESIRELFSLGVNFVVYKPVAYDRALSSMRAARAVMRKEKRKSARAAVHTHATVDYANVEQQKATLIDLAKDGMSVTFGKKLPPTSKVYFQFKLPGQSTSIRLSGQLLWQDWNGRGGVQFVDVPKASRRLLDEFLGANLPKEGHREFSDVTVEMEDPLPLPTVSVVEQTHGKAPQGSQAAVAKLEAVSPAAARVVADTDNRRSQTRYNCRLGAEVYRTGISVPHYCCLTDLSSGGCYLEVPLPFPTGTSVEILVRTYELKLRVRGTVQASHPGYGMGVAFELKTKEEQSSVKQLTDFVATTCDPA